MPTNIAVFNGVTYVIDNVFCCFFNRRCGLHGGVRAPRPTVMIVFCDIHLYHLHDISRRVRRLGAPFVYHLHELSRRGEHCSPAQREMDANKQHLPAEGNGAPSRTPGHLLLRRCRNSPCRALRRCLPFHSARLRVIINIDWKDGAAGARSSGRIAARTVEVQPKLWYTI